jgi:hypothetical protein
LVSVVLLLPINSVYAIFHSFDSQAAIWLALLAISVILVIQNKKYALGLMALSYFLLIAHRLNALVLLPFIIFLVVWVGKNRTLGLKKILTFTSLLILISSLPFIIPRLYHLSKTNAGVVGLCFEYSNMIQHSKDKLHAQFLNKLGLSIDDIKSDNPIKYRDEYAANSHKILYKIKYDKQLSKELSTLYLRMIYKEPIMFFSEKFKHLKFS